MTLHRPIATFLALLLLPAGIAAANGLPFVTTESSNYLLVGMGDKDDIDDAVHVHSSEELGANSVPFPSASPPDLTGVPALPAHAVAPAVGIFDDGNIAVTNPDGRFDLADIDVYETLGVRCANSAAGCNDGFSNIGGTLLLADVTQNAAAMTALLDELFGVGGAQSSISALANTAAWSLVGDGTKSGGTWDLSSEGGVVNSETTITLASGLNVIDIASGGSDFSLNTAHLVIQGGADAFAIFRWTEDEKNFLISNGGISIGDGGIGLNNVLFAITDRKDGEKTGTHFNFNNVLLNGAAFWDLSATGEGEIVVNNGQGCTQFIGDKLNFNDVRFGRCHFGAVPEPGSLPLVGAILLGAFGLGAIRSRGRKSA